MTKKLTYLEVQSKIDKIHNGKIKMIENTFIKLNSKASFIHEIYGQWETNPGAVLRECSHKLDGFARIKKQNSKEINRLISQLKTKDVFLYVETYINMATKAKMNHPIKGDFWATPSHVLENGYKFAKFYTIDEVKKMLPNHLFIIEDSYRSFTNKADFIDADFGQFPMNVKTVVSGGKHPERRRLLNGNKRKMTMEAINSMLPNHTTIDMSTYKNMKSKSRFLDIEFGEFYNVVNSVVKYGRFHLSRSNHFYQMMHWKNNEYIKCSYSYEKAVVEYLNYYKIDFIWQITFPMPKETGFTKYICDLYLINENKYIEIKGLYREKFKEKWKWFKTLHKNAEIWDTKVLQSMELLDKFGRPTNKYCNINDLENSKLAT